MKMILTIALVLMANIMLFSAPTINHSAFSAIPDTTKTKTAETSVTGNESKPATGTVKEAKPATTAQPAPKDIDGDYKSLQRGKKRLEYKYNLYA